MHINQLIEIVKKKIQNNIILENIVIEDKTFLHKSHKSHTEGKYHLKIYIRSKELKKKNKIESNKIIFKILDEELENYIHSIQLIIN